MAADTAWGGAELQLSWVPCGSWPLVRKLKSDFGVDTVSILDTISFL